VKNADSSSAVPWLVVVGAVVIIGALALFAVRRRRTPEGPTI
jgi:LPXTG-motif cell wall-anchored protein